MKLLRFFKSLCLLAVFAAQGGARVPYASAIPKNPSEEPVAEEPILPNFAVPGIQGPAILNPPYYISVRGKNGSFESIAIPQALRSRIIGYPIDLADTSMAHHKVIRAVRIYFKILEELLPFEQAGLSIDTQRKIAKDVIDECDCSISVAATLAGLSRVPFFSQNDDFLVRESEKIIQAACCAVGFLKELRAQGINGVPFEGQSELMETCHFMNNPSLISEWAELFDVNVKHLGRLCCAVWPSWILAVAGEYSFLNNGLFEPYIVGKVCKFTNDIYKPLKCGQFRYAGTAYADVEELDMRNTLLTSLDLTNIKTIFPNLKKINLSENLIKHLSARDITLMEGLEVDLSDNPISTIEGHTNPPFGAKIILSNTSPIIANQVIMDRLRRGSRWSHYVTTGVNILMSPLREALRPIVEMRYPAKFLAALYAPNLKKSVLAQYWRDFVWLEGGTRVLAPFREKVLGIKDEFSIVRPWIYYPAHYCAQKLFKKFDVRFTPPQEFLMSMALSVGATTADAYLSRTSLGGSIAQWWESIHEKIASYVPRPAMVAGFAAGAVGYMALLHMSEKRKPAQVIITGQADEGGMYVP